MSNFWTLIFWLIDRADIDQILPFKNISVNLVSFAKLFHPIFVQSVHKTVLCVILLNSCI